MSIHKDKTSALISSKCLVLGAAQLGLNYGINNKIGTPNFSQAGELIRSAVESNVRYIDTAQAYGNSEEVIGRVLVEEFKNRIKLITKMSNLNMQRQDAPSSAINDIVDQGLHQSQLLLGQRKIDVVMLHRASHFSEWGGAAFDRLMHHKNIGNISSIGASIQNQSELLRVIENPHISYIQMPFNLLDSRWNYAIQKIKEVKKNRRLNIHVRSVFLQGLLISNNKLLWKSAQIEDSSAITHWLIHFCKKFQKKSIAELCICYVNSFEWINGVVIGVETKEQLMQNIEYFNSTALTQNEINEMLDMRPNVSEYTLDPSMWLLNK